jgi:hypothetical protein
MVDEGSGSTPFRSEQAQALSFYAAAAFDPAAKVSDNRR